MTTEKEPFDGGVPAPGSLNRPLGDRAGCVNSGCPSASKCFRYLGLRGARSVIMEFKVSKGKDKCREFLPVFPTYSGKSPKPTAPLNNSKSAPESDW